MESPLCLIQTDTTVGFASRNEGRLNRIKGRPAGKPFLRTLGSFRELTRECRIPKRMRKKVRRSSKSTFVCGDGIARRVVREGGYGVFLRRFGWHYSTSANQSGESFDQKWAESISDVIVYEPGGFSESGGSSIFLLGKSRVKKLR